MACSLKNCVNVFGLNETTLCSKTKGAFGFCPSFGVVNMAESKQRDSPVLSNDFMGKPLVLTDQKVLKGFSIKTPSNLFVHAQASIYVNRALRWWEKTLKPNMVEIHSAQELVNSLLKAGDRLVIVNFYSPGCGGCKALHPKICQLAESNQNAIFLKVNYEELKTMSHGLHIHALPFFKFYRGADGHLCSFSCTNATIKKFKDALAKHGADRCSLGPAKGLDESEILKLASVGELSLDLPLLSLNEDRVDDLVLKNVDLGRGFWSKTGNRMELKQQAATL